MESFFKDRAVISRTTHGEEHKHPQEGNCVLPALGERAQGNSGENSEQENASTETILNAEDEGYTVEMVKVKDVVTKIKITCACGQQVTLNCQYPPLEESES